MDSRCGCAEPPATEQPAGRINKTAFKLFKRRKGGGAMPSIFGVRSRGGGEEAKGGGAAGMVRSRTHDGLAEAAMEAGGKDEPAPARGAPGGPGPVAKSHSFFSLLRKNGKAEGAERRPGGRQKKGLRSIFGSVRWHRKDKTGKEERGEVSESPPGLIMPGSLTASLECIKEEPPKPCGEERPEAGPGRDPEAPLTGCGDIIADHEEDAGGRSGGCEKSLPAAGRLGAAKKRPTVVAYQGGGEEMASPDQVDDTCLQEFWEMLSQTEETQAEEKKPEGLKENRGTEGAQNKVAVKSGGLHQIPIHLSHKEEQKGREKEQQEGVPNSDEGYWDSTTPGPEEDGSASIQKETIPRDSYSGDALYDLYAEPDENPPGAPVEEVVTCTPRSKPVSPITTTCSLKTPSSTVKDSKIPISIKHLSSHPPSHGMDTSNSHHVTHHHLAKSEMHRTKIPVSKVLVRRVSNRGLAGTTVKAAAYQDSAKK
ncbi:APC membrane recruitment protein 2 isoform X2 [Cuculus canorus]|uniref:APC membrane recruitment protein 2 isoform X2 n=1 Tax=Cuculus canorus TaxID=55661 RepID=UPI0023AAFC55|nr:APC membrane recruitment protein 2 isoform X2 [Cuculus canorus]